MIYQKTIDEILQNKNKLTIIFYIIYTCTVKKL